jgi:WD40 repeat protein
VPAAGRPKERAALRGHSDCIWDLAFSPDSQALASAGRSDGTARVWDVITGKNITTLKGHGPSTQLSPRVFVNVVAFSPDGRTVATGGGDMTVRLWDAVSGQNTATLRDQAPVTLLRFSPDGKTLFAMGAAMRLWDLKTKKARPILQGAMAGNPAVVFDPKGKLLVVGSCNLHGAGPTLALWDAETGKQTVTYEGHTKAIICATFSRDGRTLASAAWDRTIRLWDVASGKNTATFADQPGAIGCLQLSPDGKVLAVASIPAADRNDYPGTIRLLEVPSGKPLATLKGYKRSLGPLAFSPNGRLLASGGGDGTIRVWDLPARYETGKSARPQTGDRESR